MRVMARIAQSACHAFDKIIRGSVLQAFSFGMNIIPRIAQPLAKVSLNDPVSSQHPEGFTVPCFGKANTPIWYVL
jgi:hypothetical protein